MDLDVNIVRQARAGDEDSFTKLYEAIATDLYRFALYTLGNPQDAEDVVSETFIEAYKGLPKLRDETLFKPWIFKILSVRCKRKIKLYIQGKNTLDLEDYLNLESGEGDLSQEAAIRSDVLQALQALTVQERQIVILSVLQGYTTKEIAQILSCPHGTVSSKLHRTLHKLREMLRD